jgi:hypothetical protein
MKIIRPVALTDAMLTSSNVVETDHTAWNVATAYTAGNRCIVTTGVHKIYEALVNVTGGNSPEIDVLATVPKWVEVSSTNRWKAFDNKVGSQTSNATSITYSIEPGEIVDSIAFLNLSAFSVQVVVTDPVEGEVYNVTTDLARTLLSGPYSVVDWYTYFFSPFSYITDFTLFDLPPFVNAVIDITITYTGGTAEVGSIVFGLQATLGNTLYSPTVGIHDYSIKEQNAFGEWEVTERAFSNKMTCDFTVETAYISEIKNMLASYRASLLIYVAEESYSSTIIYGFYKDFSIVISYPSYAVCSVEIEGLT